MKCSFSIANNDIKGGESIGLVFEGAIDPTQIIGKTITIKLYEIDTLIGKKKESTPDDLIAEFETELLKGSAKGYYCFDPDKTNRVDSFDNTLPNLGIIWFQTEKDSFDIQKLKHNLHATICIGYVLEAMTLGFEKSNMRMEWEKVVAYVKKGMGQWLAKGLTDNGWVALYYNPDVNHPNDNDNEHIQSFLNAKKNKQYGSSAWPPVVPVFDFIVNYGPTPLTPGASFLQKPYNALTILETAQIDLLKKVPFGFLMSRGGTHTALISNGNVYQVHWTEGPASEKLFDVSGYVTEWKWNSGLIVTPRIFWPVANYLIK